MEIKYAVISSGLEKNISTYLHICTKGSLTTIFGNGQHSLKVTIKRRKHSQRLKIYSAYLQSQLC